MAVCISKRSRTRRRWDLLEILEIATGLAILLDNLINDFILNKLIKLERILNYSLRLILLLFLKMMLLFLTQRFQP